MRLAFWINKKLCLEAFFLSLSPPAELPGMGTASTSSSTRSSSFSQPRDEEHNAWSPVPGSAVHFHVAKSMEEMLGGEQLGIIPMSCRFALDLLCDKKSSTSRHVTEATICSVTYLS